VIDVEDPTGRCVECRRRHLPCGPRLLPKERSERAKGTRLSNSASSMQETRVSDLSQASASGKVAEIEQDLESLKANVYYLERLLSAVRR